MPLQSQFADIVLRNEPAGQYYLNCCKKHGEKIAIIDTDDNGRSLTYSELYQSSVRLGNFLRNSAGLQHGDVVGVCCPNFIEIPIIMVATINGGGIYSPINPSYTPDEMIKLFGISKPKLIFTSKDMLEKLEKISQSVPSIKKVYTVDGDGPNSLSSLLGDANSQVAPVDVVGIDPLDVCILPFSSGTTGLPKGVMLTHKCMTSADTIYRSTAQMSKSFVSLHNLPNFHVYGIIKYFMAMSSGSTMISCQKFTTLHDMLMIIQKYKVTDLSSVPPLLLGMANLPDLEKYDLSSVVRITSGAAPLPESVAKTIKRRTGLSISQAWGLTEFGPITGATNDTVPITSVGLVLPNTLLKVIDTETSKELGPNQRGELCAKGNQTMKGYYNRPSATSQCIDADGWFHTGDIGYYDENECVYIVDRLKELIKYKGFQVAPAELEEVLLEHPDIADVGVVGIPDENAGQVPRAFIVKKRASLTEGDIHAFLKGRVSHYKYLRGGVEFRTAIPKTASGKILRKVLRDLHSAKPKPKL